MYAKHIKEKKTGFGARLFAAPFPAHGSVSLVGSIAGGALLAGSREFASVHADMLMGGTRSHTKKELQIALDSLGASLTFSANSERLIFSVRVRAVHLEKLLKLIAEILTEPTFPARELSLLKKREAASLSLAEQDTRTRAGIAFSRLLFQTGHPNHAETIEESRAALARISPATLRAYHQKILSADSLIASFAGNIEPPQAFALAEKYFKRLPPKKITLPSYRKSVPRKARREVVHVPHKASIDYMIGTATGITKDNSDYAPLALGMQVLGNVGGFTGRLMKTVREKEGLTYGVYAYTAGFSDNADGDIYVWATFAPQMFAQGRAAIQREVWKIAEKGITAAEAKKHREMFEARWRVQLSNSGALAAAAHAVGVEGREVSYLDEFPRRMAQLTAAQVNRALKKYLVPQSLSEVAAGSIEKKALGA